MLSAIDFEKTPFLTIWETTRACDLACRHCRASAQTEPLPGELSTVEGFRLLHQIREMGCPIVVLSGGDPLKRSDLIAWIRYGKSLGLRMATIPAATKLLTRNVIQNLKQAELDQIAFSLDFPRESLHDAFRNSPGAFARTMEAVQWAQDSAIPVQINTTITSETLPYLTEMAELVSRLGIVFWEVFFLVPVGRGENLPSLSAEDCEKAFEILYRTHRKSDFVLKVTEAPHYRRYVAQQEGTGPNLPYRLRRSEGPGGSIGRAPRGVNAGNGFLFISYKGDVYPSGFLPISAGNVRLQDLTRIYRENPLFRSLRNPEQFLGRCGYCDFRQICGGSRSRAYALTGNYLATDPWCAYRPPRRRPAQE